MCPSTFPTSIASISTLSVQTGRPLLFLDPELEALYRAGSVGERPAALLTATLRVFGYAAGVLSSAAARRAVL